MPLNSTYTAESLAGFFFTNHSRRKSPIQAILTKRKFCKRQSQRRYLALKTSGASDKNYTIASCLYMYTVCWKSLSWWTCLTDWDNQIVSWEGSLFFIEHVSLIAQGNPISVRPPRHNLQVQVSHRTSLLYTNVYAYTSYHTKKKCHYPE